MLRIKITLKDPWRLFFLLTITFWRRIKGHIKAVAQLFECLLVINLIILLSIFVQNNHWCPIASLRSFVSYSCNLVEFYCWFFKNFHLCAFNLWKPQLILNLGCFLTHAFSLCIFFRLCLLDESFECLRFNSFEFKSILNSFSFLSIKLLFLAFKTIL